MAGSIRPPGRISHQNIGSEIKRIAAMTDCRRRSIRDNFADFA